MALLLAIAALGLIIAIGLSCDLRRWHRKRSQERSECVTQRGWVGGRHV